MTSAAWVCLGIMALGVLTCVYRNAYERGYAAGQYKERRAAARVISDEKQRARAAVARMIDDERQRALAAESAIDYLYERARWQMVHQGPAAVQNEE